MTIEVPGDVFPSRALNLHQAPFPSQPDFPRFSIGFDLGDRNDQEVRNPLGINKSMA
jgi:hypothetical protein